MEKFTKGPWKSSGHSCVLAGDIVLCALTHSSVTTEDVAEDYANANLIAAAPDMYAMLKAIANGASVATYEINELLAKARGEK